MTEQRTQIPDELAGQRLDQALAQMFPEYSRSRLKAWLLNGAVLVDGELWRPRDRVAGGETVELQVVPEVAVRAGPEVIPLDVVFEDDALLVVNKPVGLVVHPGAGNVTGTLMNGLLHHAPSLEQLPRAGIIHRLDKDTSGLLLVAKTLLSHTALLGAWPTGTSRDSTWLSATACSREAEPSTRQSRGTRLIALAWPCVRVASLRLRITRSSSAFGRTLI